ncbi:MAG: aldehyde dehydrogenase family protein [Stappiaceae bacterium]
MLEISGMKSSAVDLYHFINGKWLPVEQSDVAECGSGGAETLSERDREIADRAVQAARAAFDNGWNRAGLAVRLETLTRLIGEIDKRREEFAQLISAEIGAPIDFARKNQVDTALNHLAAILAAAKDNHFDIPVSPEQPEHRIRYEPMGVAVLITPWNWPLNQIALKVGAALIAGCTMILKPSELAPLTGLLFAECLETAGVPPGVFNLVSGNGSSGAQLCASKNVNIISLTGSTRSGRAVALSAAANFTRVALELGGKSPNLLFADCDLEIAVKQGVAHCFRNAGQSCNAASRMLVEDCVYDHAVTLAAREAENTTVGYPNQPGSHIGPLVSETQFDRVQNYIRQALDEGATLVAGGLGRPDGFDEGFFVKPTVFADVTPEMSIAQEEVFGPVLTVSRFKDEGDALTQANHSDYGLAAYVQTTDMNRADRLACRLQAGMIQVNGTSRAQGAPFGGTKASGIGREAGIWGIRTFQEIKSISGTPFASISVRL